MLSRLRGPGYKPAGESSLQDLTAIIAMLLLATAAYGDVCRRRIPNKLTIALALLGLLRVLAAGAPLAAVYTFAATAIVLLLGIALFARGVLGGGDAKLLTGAVLLVGYRAVPDLLFITGLSGGLVALIVVGADKLGPWLQQVPVAIGLYGAPPRLVALLQRGMDRWLSHLRLPAPAPMGADPTRARPPRPSVPYGLAIAVGGVAVLLSQFSITG